MKKFCSLLLVMLLLFTLSACGNEKSASDTKKGTFCTECGEEVSVTDKFCGSCGASIDKTNGSDDTDASSSTTSTPTTNTKPTITADALQAQIDAQELRVINTKYAVQDENYKTLYPDMLQAIIQNDTAYDIKNAVVAFVAWDSNNLPVKIKGSIDFSDGAYIRQVNYSDINLVPGQKYGESSGYEIDEECNIKTFKAIIVSYESFDGITWENPLYEDWCELYEGVKLQ